MQIKNLKEIDLKYMILTLISFIIMMSFSIHKILQSRQKIESKNEIPDNVIRIETQDGSGEYIEIELPEENGTNNDDELNTLLNEAKDILYEISPLSSIQSTYENLTAGEYVDALLDAITILPLAKVLKAKKIASKINKAIDKNKSKKDVKILKKSKYATKQEVIKTLRNKYKLKTSEELNKAGYKQYPKNKNVYMAKDNKQIKEIWDDITEGAEVLEDKINPKTGEKIPMRKLSDGTILKLRKTSDSGGSTIEIGDKKIHNKAKENGDW